MGLLDGKRLLVTGVITDQSIAFSVAKLAQQEANIARRERCKGDVMLRHGRWRERT